VQFDKSTRTDYLAFAVTAAPFGDVNVRQAINHAIDRAAITKRSRMGMAHRPHLHTCGAEAHDPAIPLPTRDLTLAKEYLAKSSVTPWLHDDL